jgi:hypothetical protein
LASDDGYVDHRKHLDLIEQEARRRAVEGYDRPIFQRGQIRGAAGS